MIRASESRLLTEALQPGNLGSRVGFAASAAPPTLHALKPDRTAIRALKHREYPVGVADSNSTRSGGSTSHRRYYPLIGMRGFSAPAR